MNRQNPGIEWTHVFGPGTGFTWNPVQGCKHACQWEMSDGTIAECYAKTIAEKFRSPKFMPNGFEEHYWHPERLQEPLKLKSRAGIFLDSFSDLMGTWVTDEQIEQVLDVCRRAEQHIFFLLTKNAPRLKQFDFPQNVWTGVSSPPDHMFGKALRPMTKNRMLHTTLKTLSEVNSVVRWISFEPLSWDVSWIVKKYPGVLQWAVIGAASNGAKHYPPHPAHFLALLHELDEQGVPVFYKGNLRSLSVASPWREDFPERSEYRFIESVIPLPTIQVIDPTQATINGLEHDLSVIAHEYADLSDAHVKVVNENVALKAAIRDLLQRDVVNSAWSDWLRQLIGDQPPQTVTFPAIEIS